jgi:NADH dehydrogenase
MKVLVTGGTGFVGRQVVGDLVSRGHWVKVLARDPDAAQARGWAGQTAVQVVAGDVLEAGGLRAALAGMEGVVHLVGIISECREITFERLHVQATRNVLTAMGQACVRRLVHMSALGTRPQAASTYHQTKWAAEELVRASGLDYTIFRPSIIYGPGDQFINRFAQVMRYSPVVPVMGSGQARLQPVSVANVGRAFALALADARTRGQTIDLCGPETLTFNQILDGIMQATGRRRLKIHLPLGVARLLAAGLEILFPALLRRPPPLNRQQLIMLQEDHSGDFQTAANLFDLGSPFLTESIQKYLLV